MIQGTDYQMKMLCGGTVRYTQLSFRFWRPTASVLGMQSN